MKQEMTGFGDDSGISWTICKQSAPRSRQITTPTPHRSIFTDRMLFMTPNQQCQSIEGFLFLIGLFLHRMYCHCCVKCSAMAILLTVPDDKKSSSPSDSSGQPQQSARNSLLTELKLLQSATTFRHRVKTWTLPMDTGK